MKYLIVITVPEARAEVVDGILDMAGSFLATRGAVDRRDLGGYVRALRRGGFEVLRVVEFTANQAGSSSAIMRALEDVLKRTLASGAESGEVTVFTTGATTPAAAPR